jgi:hypothetical protein
MVSLMLAMLTLLEGETPFAMPPLSWPPPAKRQFRFELVWPPLTAPIHEAETYVVCTMRIVPADPGIDREMVVSADPNVDPEMVRPAFCRASNDR